MDERTIVALVIGIVALLTVVVAGGAVRIVPVRRVGVVERLGRYRRTVQPGVHVVMPFVDRVRVTVDTTEQTRRLTDLHSQTSDGVPVAVEALLRFQVVDPAASIYQVADLHTALVTQVATGLRLLLADRTLDQARASLHELGDRLQAAMADNTHAWGVELRHVEIIYMDRASR